jgi:hypothetical protein
MVLFLSLLQAVLAIHAIHVLAQGPHPGIYRRDKQHALKIAHGVNPRDIRVWNHGDEKEVATTRTSEGDVDSFTIVLHNEKKPTTFKVLVAEDAVQEEKTGNLWRRVQRQPQSQSQDSNTQQQQQQQQPQLQQQQQQKSSPQASLASVTGETSSASSSFSSSSANSSILQTSAWSWLWNQLAPHIANWLDIEVVDTILGILILLLLVLSTVNLFYNAATDSTGNASTSASGSASGSTTQRGGCFRC